MREGYALIFIMPPCDYCTASAIAREFGLHLFPRAIKSTLISCTLGYKYVTSARLIFAITACARIMPFRW